MGEVGIREVEDGDLAVFFEHQRDPEGAAMAAFPPREWDAFVAHWDKVRADESALTRTVLVDGAVAGNVASWAADGERLVGYWRSAASPVPPTPRSAATTASRRSCWYGSSGGYPE